MTDMSRFLPPGTCFRTNNGFIEDNLEPAGSVPDQITPDNSGESRDATQTAEVEEEARLQRESDGTWSLNGRRIESTTSRGGQVTYRFEDGGVERFDRDDNREVDFSQGRIISRGDFEGVSILDRPSGQSDSPFLGNASLDSAQSADAGLSGQAAQQETDGLLPQETTPTPTAPLLGNLMDARLHAETSIAASETARANYFAARDEWLLSFVPVSEFNSFSREELLEDRTPDHIYGPDRTAGFVIDYDPEQGEGQPAHYSSTGSRADFWRQHYVREITNVNDATGKLNAYVESLEGKPVTEGSAEHRQYLDLEKGYDDAVERAYNRLRGLGGYISSEDTPETYLQRVVDRVESGADSTKRDYTPSESPYANVRDAYTAWETAYGAAVAARDHLDTFSDDTTTPAISAATSARAVTTPPDGGPAQFTGTVTVNPDAVDVSPAEGVGYDRSEAIRGGNLGDAVLDEERGVYVHPVTGETWTREVGDAARGIGVGYTMSEGVPPENRVSDPSDRPTEPVKPTAGLMTGFYDRIGAFNEQLEGFRSLDGRESQGRHFGLDRVIENAQGFVGPQRDEEEAQGGVQGDINAAVTLAPQSASYGDDLAGVTTTTVNTDAVLDSATGGPRVHVGAAAPATELLGGLPEPSLPLAGSVGDAVQTPDATPVRYPGDVGHLADVADGDRGPREGVDPATWARIASHNQSTVAQFNTDRRNTSLAQGYGDDLQQEGSGSALNALRNITAENFYETLRNVPQTATIDGRKVDLVRQFPGLADTPSGARLRRDQQGTGILEEQAAKIAKAARAGTWTFEDTSGPERVYIRKPDETAEGTHIHRFERDVQAAINEGKVIVLQEPRSELRQIRDAAEWVVPGFGALNLYETRRQTLQGSGFITEQERGPIALGIVDTAADIADIGGVAAAAGGSGRLLFRGARAAAAAGTADFKLNQLHGILKSQPDGQQALQKVKDFEQGGVDTLTAYETVAKDRGVLPADYGPTQTAPVRSEPSVVNFETTYGGGYARGYQSSTYFRPEPEPAAGAGLTDVPTWTPNNPARQKTALLEGIRAEKDAAKDAAYEQTQALHGRGGYPTREVQFMQAELRYGKGSPQAGRIGGYDDVWLGDAGPSYTTSLQSRVGGPPSRGGGVPDPGDLTQILGPRSTPAAEGPVAPSAATPSGGVAVAELPATNALDLPVHELAASRVFVPATESAAIPATQGLTVAQRRSLLNQERWARIRAAAAEQQPAPAGQAATVPDPQPTPFTGQIAGTTPTNRLYSTTAEVPTVQTSSGLVVPASAIPVDAFAAGVQTSPAIGVESATTLSPQIGTAPLTEPVTITQAEAAQRLQTASQTATQVELAPGLRTVVQPETAPAFSTAPQIEVVPDLRNLLQVQPELAPLSSTSGQPRTWEIDVPNPKTGTPGQPGGKPWEIDIPGPRPETPQPQPWQIDLPGTTPGMPTGQPWDIDVPDTRLERYALPALGTARMVDTASLTDPDAATVESPAEIPHTGTFDIPGPATRTPEEEGGRLDAPAIRRRQEEGRNYIDPKRRVEQPVPTDARPVESGRPLGENEFPRHVAHEEVVLDVPREDGSVDRVLVEMGDPKITAVDNTEPPPGEHIAGNQRITASGKSVWGESVNPVLPPRDAAQQYPEGQVEESVFVTDVDTGETTVHRFREPRRANESLEEQLERLSDEEIQVIAAGSVPRETGPDQTEGMPEAVSQGTPPPRALTIGQRIRITAERVNAEARERAAGAAEGIAAGIETSDQLAEAQQRLDNARQRMDAEEHARRQTLGPRGRAAEDARGKAARWRGTATATPERSAAYQKAAQDYASAEADIQRLKGKSTGGVAAAIGRAGATAPGGGNRLSPQFREMINTLAQSGAQKNAPKTANRRSSGVRDKDLKRPPAMTGSQSINLGGGTILTINRGRKKRR